MGDGTEGDHGRSNIERLSRFLVVDKFALRGLPRVRVRGPLRPVCLPRPPEEAGRGILPLTQPRVTRHT